VDVLPIPLECTKGVSASASGPFNPDLDLGNVPAGSPPIDVFWQITVHNPNSFDLANVVVSENTALPERHSVLKQQRHGDIPADDLHTGSGRYGHDTSAAIK